MPYEDWDTGFQDVYESTPGTQYLEDWETGHVETLFETGFTMDAIELESLGYTEDDVQAIRDEFFDYLGIDRDDFDWEGWREAMGYE